MILLSLFLVAPAPAVASAHVGVGAGGTLRHTALVDGSRASDYACTPDPTGQSYAWIDATQGTELLEAEGDDVIGQMPWPFDFAVYGQVYTAGVDVIEINSNGAVHLDQGGQRSLWPNGGEIPTTRDGQYVALLGDDLVSSSIWSLLTGDPGNRVLTIQYLASEEYGRGPGVAHLEVSFYQATGDIVIQVLIVTPFSFASDGVVGLNAGDGLRGVQVFAGSDGGLPSNDFDVACARTSSAATIHVDRIDGAFVPDTRGRTVLRAQVFVADENDSMIPHVLVDASIWAPLSGPHVRSRYTKTTGAASFHWGSVVDGKFVLCVDRLTLAGYTYLPADNALTCASWRYQHP